MIGVWMEGVFCSAWWLTGFRDSSDWEFAARRVVTGQGFSLLIL